MSIATASDIISRPRQSYWQRDVPQTSARPELNENISAEFVIIGGGLAGLSTALQIFEQKPGSEIIILESEYIGFGASGRAGGLLSPFPAPIWVIGAKNNEDQYWGLGYVNRRMHETANWIRTNCPHAECIEEPLHVKAMGPISGGVLEQTDQTLKSTGIEFEFRASESKGRWPTLFLPAHTVHPYRLVCELGAAVERRGAHIFENSAVNSVSQTQDGTHIHLDNGFEVTARSVIVCTNAYTSYISGLGPISAKPVYTYILATEKLDNTQLASFDQSKAFTVELNKENAYYRTHDNRIIFGAIDKSRNANAAEFEVPHAVLRDLSDLFNQSFPGLKPRRFSDTWSGAYHLSLTDLPIVKRLDDNPSVILNVGYGGTGLAFTFICAPLAAALAIGKDFPTTDDQRLFDTIKNTRPPIMSGLLFGAGIGAAVIRSSVFGQSTQ